MSTIEDKLLNGPTVHYCDADNDDIRTGEDSDDDKKETSSSRNDLSSLFVRPCQEDDEPNRTDGRHACCSTNTGPKGVLEDYRKQSLPKSSLGNANADLNNLETEFQALMNDDDIIKQIARSRLAQARGSSTLPQFGRVYRLNTGNELLESIDKEHPDVLIIVHIYTKYSRVCSRVDKCLDKLAQDINHVKIVTLDASVAGLSENFKRNGVPALLAYRNANLIKSLLQLEDLLDRDFNHQQIKELLVEAGLLE